MNDQARRATLNIVKTLRLSAARTAALALGATALAGLLLFGLDGRDASAAFPGLNGKIAFVSGRVSAGNTEIYVMNPDGSGQTNVGNNAYYNRYPAWSPDGTRIAFTTYRANDEIYVMNVDGSGDTNITNNPAFDREPAWSPDGTWIAFTRIAIQSIPPEEIYVMNADGSGQTNLSNNPAHDFSPAWSPDGTKIAFTRSDTADTQIYVMNPDGSGQTQLTNDGGADPNWSPDGTRIAFTSNPGGNNTEISVINVNGTGLTNLSNNPTSDYSPVWSPDGTKVAFGRGVGLNAEIYVMNADGSGQTNVSNNPANDHSPDWQRLAPPPPPPPPPPARCGVPRVLGLRLAAAKTRIHRAHCSVGRISRVRSRRVGRVLRQSPRAGALRRRGFRVRLVVGRR